MAGESRGVPSTNPSGAAEAPAAGSTAEPAAGYWVQLGAYRQREGATAFQQRVAAELDWLAPRLGVFDDNALFRLQAGPYASRDEASAVAERVRTALQLVPMIVERR
jgi:rare lipoprotein A